MKENTKRSSTSPTPMTYDPSGKIQYVCMRTKSTNSPSINNHIDRDPCHNQSTDRQQVFCNAGNAIRAWKQCCVLLYEACEILYYYYTWRRLYLEIEEILTEFVLIIPFLPSIFQVSSCFLPSSGIHPCPPSPFLDFLKQELTVKADHYILVC